MKAFVYEKYGSPDVLELREVEKPTPKDDEVLVKLHAVSLNASDWEILRGKPAYARIYGLLKPKIRILGSDIAGWVEAVGGNVTQFQPGDEVFGDTFGSFGGFAEYVCAREDKLMLKPATMTFEQAAALPQAGVLALQGLRDKGQIQPGQKVLINGAGGVAFVTNNGRNDDVETGFVIGTGTDVKLSDGVSLGMDGLYYVFDDGGKGAIIDPSTDNPVRGLDDDNEFFVVRARLTFHFQDQPTTPLK